MYLTGFPTGVENTGGWGGWGGVGGSSKFDGGGGLSQYMGGAKGAINSVEKYL